MVEFAAMTEAEFEEYLDRAVPQYAEVHLRAGDCEPSEALELAQAEYTSLLPEGLASPGHHLFSIFDSAGGARVGMLWFAVKVRRGGQKWAFLYDFEVLEAERGKGYGRRTLEKLDETLAAMDVARVSLNVFGHNTVARALYEKHGYAITAIGMTKRIG
jgi:ribosomal protein S18 acetylase RimI-like enzyme